MRIDKINNKNLRIALPPEAIHLIDRVSPSVTDYNECVNSIIRGM